MMCRLKNIIFLLSSLHVQMLDAYMWILIQLIRMCIFLPMTGSFWIPVYFFFIENSVDILCCTCRFKYKWTCTHSHFSLIQNTCCYLSTVYTCTFALYFYVTTDYKCNELKKVLFSVKMEIFVRVINWMFYYSEQALIDFTAYKVAVNTFWCVF